MSNNKIKSQHPDYPCTECGKDAFLAYACGEGDETAWDGKVKNGERLCTSCFMKRGGENFLRRKKP